MNGFVPLEGNRISVIQPIDPFSPLFRQFGVVNDSLLQGFVEGSVQTVFGWSLRPRGQECYNLFPLGLISHTLLRLCASEVVVFLSSILKMNEGYFFPEYFSGMQR